MLAQREQKSCLSLTIELALKFDSLPCTARCRSFGWKNKMSLWGNIERPISFMWWFGLSSFWLSWSQWLEHRYALLAICKTFDVCFSYGKWTLCGLGLFKAESLMPSTQRFGDLLGRWYKIAHLFLFVLLLPNEDRGFNSTSQKCVFWFVSPSTLSLKQSSPGSPLSYPLSQPF